MSFELRTINTQNSRIQNSKLPNNCQLSTVNCQLSTVNYQLSTYQLSTCQYQLS
ncbi:MAG: hypothetical protein HC894_29090, partial [Microcoleus sp. SM1_3_4]|nr:hypothetical protein [Microcoleus sp. SM1_3_4]